jgi:hypothetical protein
MSSRALSGAAPARDNPEESDQRDDDDDDPDDGHEATFSFKDGLPAQYLRFWAAAPLATRRRSAPPKFGYGSPILRRSSSRGIASGS